MSESKPPPRTLEPADDRVIQAFLERASMIVVDNSVLDAQRWSSLVSLAEELGLSDKQFRETVNDLRDRGVIHAIDLAPPAPPPLPNAGVDQAAEPGSDRAIQAQPEVDFALTPHLAERASPPPPPSSPSPIDGFLERASAILAEQRGFGPRTHALLAATASEMGLTDEEAAAALSRFDTAKPGTPTEPARPAEPPPYDDSEEIASRQRWRVQGQPTPEPPAPTRMPADVYRDFLRASLAQIEDRVVTRFMEKKLLKHGTGVLGLARAYAGQLFHDEVAAQKCHLESAVVVEETSEGDDNDTLGDPDIQLFLDRSVPILAEHRGITAKSRVLLNAIAEELGLSPQQVESAIAAAQFRATTKQDTEDVKQAERFQGFRALVQGTLVSLPRKILTRDIEADLMRHGQELHGLGPAQVQAAIRDVCTSLEIRQISEDKARMHIESLVDSKLSETPRLSMDTRLRMLSEGEQWGLTSDEVASIIKERTRAQEAKRRSEERFARGALFAAGMAILIVFGLFVWIMFGGGRASLVPKEGQDESPVVVEEINEAEIDTDWWNADLHADASNARLLFAPQREALKQLESADPLVRASGYSRVIDLLTDGARTSQHEALLIRILTLAYDREPDSAAAGRLLDRVLSRIPQAENELFADERVYVRAFLAARAAAALVRSAHGDRQAAAVTALGKAIDYSLDLNYDGDRLDTVCRDQTAERLLALLIALAETSPTRAADVHPFVINAIELHDCLDEGKLAARNADFLIAFLTAAPNAWEPFVPLIEEVIDSEDRANAVLMLRVYETTGNSELRKYMAELLLRVAEAEVADRDVVTVAMAVRKSLGVSDVAMADVRTRRFLQDADAVIRERLVDVGKPDAMIRQIIQLARLSTLGCAVGGDEAGSAVFERLLEQDSDALLGGVSPFEEVKDTPSPPEPTTFRQLTDKLHVIASPDTAAGSRAAAIEGIARLDQIHDLAPKQAEVLGKYMVSRKRVEEHRIVVEHAAELARWKQVRLAVADQLASIRLPPEETQQLVSKLLGREYKLQPGVAGREALRSELLRSVLEDLHREDVAGREKYRAYDRLSHAMRQLYSSQAEAFLVPEISQDAKSPAIVLKDLTKQVTARMLAGELVSWQRKELDRVSTELRAIDYYATSDLERQVLLERSWLRLLMVRAAIRRPQRRTEAERLLISLAEQDARAANVLHQLRDGQLAILKMWILHNRPE